MRERLLAVLLSGSVLVLGACTASRDGQGADPPAGEPPSSTAAAPSTIDPPPTSLTASPTDPTVATTGSVAPGTTGTAGTTATTVRPRPPRTTTSTSTTTTAPTTTTTAPKPRPQDLPEPCVWKVESGDSLSLIASGVRDRKVTVRSLQRENSISDPDQIRAGDKIDVCVGNHIDDVTGKKRTPPKPEKPTRPPSAPSTASGVSAQQQKLNELFNGMGMPTLSVDGDSGQLTEQQLCAARMGLNLPISRNDMEPGSPEEQALMSARWVSIPKTAPSWAGRWALVDQTCQVMYVGDGGQLKFVFPVSTGQPGFETRDQSASRVFRYDPARENGGWHDSTQFPAEEDNPLNGNMYKPLYFDSGQAIHGANTVPPEPASHGCVRVPVDHQDILVSWLGLADVPEATYDEDLINLTVTVQGRY